MYIGRPADRELEFDCLQSNLGSFNAGGGGGMEDDQNGRRPKWKTSKMEDDQNGKRPEWKTTRMEDDQNGR